MGCGSCSTSGLPKGCRNNGSCGVDGCEKLTVFDWLSDMELPSDVIPFDCLEVRFKNGRKEFYKNVNDLKLYMGDIVAVEGSPGHDVGVVSLSGELVRLQMNKRKVSPNSPEVKKLYRKANQRDIDLWRKAQEREDMTRIGAREIVNELGLDMKLSDVEFQGDNSKATFYYIAEHRVDFRELIKRLASAFKIRVEMRQIGSRQEAGKIGGIGSCGRELCCSTWLTDFRSVNTSAARYQQLSLNPTKLAGQCGKLKCCLNYELDSYMDALKKFPDTNKPLETKNGKANFMKMDIFKEVLWYQLPEKHSEWVSVKLEDVQRIMAMNEKGEMPETLQDFHTTKPSEEETAYENVVGQDELTRFDRQKGQGNKRRGRGRKPQGKGRGPKTQGKGPQGKANQSGDNAPKQNPQGQKQEGNKPQAKRRRPSRNRNRKPKDQGNNNAKSE